MKAALVISARDNVATALEGLEPGRALELGGTTVTTIEPIASGHKVALRAIAAGEPVIKYGSSIGIATADIPAGAHVHTHNLAGTRGRGDLDVAAPTMPRLAEPPDEQAGTAPNLAADQSPPAPVPRLNETGSRS